MTPAAWIAVVLACYCAWLLVLLVMAMDQRDAARAEVIRLEAVLDNALLDYGSQIAQSKRMARNVLERLQ